MNSDKSMQQLMDEFVGEYCIPEKRDSAQQEIKGLFMGFMGTLAFHTLKLSPPSSSTSESPPPQGTASTTTKNKNTALEKIQLVKAAAEANTLINTNNNNCNSSDEDSELSIEQLQEDEFQYLKVVQLRQILKKASQKYNGNKSDLIQRCKDYKNGIYTNKIENLDNDNIRIKNYTKPEIQKMKVQQIQTLLKKEGLRVMGNKNVLVERADRFIQDKCTDEDYPSKKKGRKKSEHTKQKVACAAVESDGTSCTREGKKECSADKKMYCYRHIPREYVKNVEEPSEPICTRPVSEMVHQQRPKLSVVIPTPKYKDAKVVEIPYTSGNDNKLSIG